MFDFELLPNEMQLEVLKRTPFRTVQSMKSVSRRVKKFIQVYKKYMMPVPIRQMLVTPEKISFTLAESNEVCSVSAEHLGQFLHGAQIDLLWLEAIGTETEPIALLQSIIGSFSRVNCLKLGSSKAECDVEKLTEFMEHFKCTELIVDWRFRLPEHFFNDLHIEKLTSLTIGGQQSRHLYGPFSGENFREFRGFWLEIGPNRLAKQDFRRFFQDWKSGNRPSISQYNIVISFPISELLNLLRNETRQETSTRWSISREIEGVKEELQIVFFRNTAFSENPSIVMRQFRFYLESAEQE